MGDCLKDLGLTSARKMQTKHREISNRVIHFFSTEVKPKGVIWLCEGVGSKLKVILSLKHYQHHHRNFLSFTSSLFFLNKILVCFKPIFILFCFYSIMSPKSHWTLQVATMAPTEAADTSPTLPRAHKGDAAHEFDPATMVGGWWPSYNGLCWVQGFPSVRKRQLFIDRGFCIVFCLVLFFSYFSWEFSFPIYAPAHHSRWHPCSIHIKCPSAPHHYSVRCFLCGLGYWRTALDWGKACSGLWWEGLGLTTCFLPIWGEVVFDISQGFEDKEW